MNPFSIMARAFWHRLGNYQGIMIGQVRAGRLTSVTGCVVVVRVVLLAWRLSYDWESSPSSVSSFVLLVRDLTAIVGNVGRRSGSVRNKCLRSHLRGLRTLRRGRRGRWARRRLIAVFAVRMRSGRAVRRGRWSILAFFLWGSPRTPRSSASLFLFPLPEDSTEVAGRGAFSSQRKCKLETSVSDTGAVSV
ncbi:hypothetical protein DFH11DRAFT_1602328 [Phellopilus nigrolimitatus]|nr:hypothetical protein DFH11DRAFT_1602328 [Phellopilus nigrolimitatus]